MKKIALLNDIAARNHVLGSLCGEAEKSYEAENYMAALACLFIVIEGCLKYYLDIDPDDKWGLHKVIEKAQADGRIDAEQYSRLKQIKELRNEFLHDDHYSYAVEYDGLLYPFYEEETKKLLYELHSLFVFKLVHQFAVSHDIAG